MFFVAGGDGGSSSDPLSIFEKYADSFDSNGYAAELVSLKKIDVGAGATGDKSISSDINEFLLDHMCVADFSQLMGKSQDGASGSAGAGGGVSSAISLSSNTNDIEMDTNYFKEKLLAAAQAATQNNNNNNNGNNNNDVGLSVSKMTVSEEIDVVMESCTSVKRMNVAAAVVGEREVVEIAEILPTNGNCNQLLVKLVKKRAPEEAASQIIMATVEVDLEDERMTEEDGMYAGCHWSAS